MTALDRILAGTTWRIGEPAVLAALALAVIGAAIAGVAGVALRRALLRRAYGEVGARVAPDARAGRRLARLAVACTGLALLAVAAARPRAGVGVEQVPVAGVDLVVVLDASRSMLARDVEPDRLTRAKRDVSSLVDRLPGVRVAVVAFAGSAHVQSPLTSDLRAAKLLLGAVDPAAMPVQGTDVAKALEVASAVLAADPRDGGARVALLVGDGEDHGAGAADAAERLALDGVALFTAGTGTPSGARVPVGGGDLVDARGRAVLSRLEEDRLVDLAGRGGGRYVRLDGSDAGVAELAATLSRLERASARTVRVSAWEERFEWFAAPGLLLLALAAATPEASRPARRARRRSAAVAALTFAALLLAGASPFLAEHRGLAEANALAARDPDAALRLIDAVEREVGPRPEIEIDRGIALFRAGRLAESRRSFALSQRAPATLASRGAYAEGVAALAQGEEAAAIAAWRHALVLDPANGAARFNLEVALRRIAEPRSGEAFPVEPQRGETSGPVERSRGTESRERGRDVAERDGAASANRGDAAEREPTASANRGDATEREPSVAPMSRDAALRLLDSVASSERVMPMAPPRGRESPPAQPW
ncbi:MAG TPA: VWA domain-containing protein [Anaeromyxobacteraceae bacterium]|nr:VWA domain-containing protein [Anaeromyxobacteraceae bacterium]